MAGNNGYTVTDLINEALSHLGVYTGDPLDAADLQSAFQTFVFMMDGWTAEPLTIFAKGVSSFNTAAGQTSYVLGVGSGDWQIAALPAGYDAITQGPAGTGLELPVNMIGNLEYDSIALKGMTSGILDKCNVTPLASSHSLAFWPTPSQTIQVNLYISQRIPAFTAVSNSVVLPPGYLEAITFELAAKLAAKFRAQIPEFLPQALMDAKSKIKAKNWPALEMRVDRDLVRRDSRLGGSIEFYEGR